MLIVVAIIIVDINNNFSVNDSKYNMNRQA